MAWDSMEWVGAAAASCTTLCFIPQVVKALRERDTRAISLGMYSLFTFGVALWFIYGLHLGSWPMMVSNALTFVLAGVILMAKLRFK